MKIVINDFLIFYARFINFKEIKIINIINLKILN